MNITKYYLPQKMLTLDEYRNYGESRNGIKQFGNENRTCFLSSKSDSINLYSKEKCLHQDPTKKNLLLIGDSHAAVFSQAFTENFPNYNIIQVSASGCAPLIKTSGSSRCVDLMKLFYNSIIKNIKFDAIFVSANWYLFESDATEKNLLETDNTLKKLTKNVFFIGQSRAFDSPFYKLAQHYNSNEIIRFTSKGSYSYNANALKNINPSINYIDIFDVGCEQKKCNFFLENIPMMFDGNHFTLEWTEYLTKNIFLPLIEKSNHSN